MKRVGPIGVSAALLALSGCGGPKAYVRQGFLEHPPRRVAVLPFVITYPYDLQAEQALPTSHTVGRDVFRKTLYYALTPYGYEDIKLSDVDRRLSDAWGPIESGAWRQASPQALGQALGADALIYGELSRLIYFSTPLYTQASLTASLRMVEAATGETLWRQEVSVAERGGALLQSGQVVDLLKDQARSFNPRVKFLRVSDVAVKRALKGLPNPPMSMEASHQPEGVAGQGAAVRLAVLPFGAKHKNWEPGAPLLRTYLTASLQESPFEVVEIQRVDAALKELGWTEGAPLPASLSLAKLADALDADAVLLGTVTDWGRTYLIVQSWVKAELHVELIDPRSGEVIWSEKKRNTRQAGLLKGPTGYKAIATAPIMGLKTSHLERVASHLTRALADDLGTSPAVMAYLNDIRQR